jgi:membrane-associated phospholipid phosphatase
VIWFGFAAAYQVARGLADRGADEAFANARRVVRLEQHLNALVEPDIQRPVVRTGGLLLHAVNWTYWLSQFAVVGLALLWIYLRRNGSYLRVRNTIIVANTIGLVGYVVLPTAPPRLLPALGFTDTLARAEALNHGTGFVELAANPYAAMPSLHAADALIIGVALAAVVRHPLLKILFALWPAWVAFALIASGNHFWLDLAAGFLLAAVGAHVARRLDRRPNSTGSASVSGPLGGTQAASPSACSSRSSASRSSADTSTCLTRSRVIPSRRAIASIVSGRSPR